MGRTSLAVTAKIRQYLPVFIGVLAMVGEPAGLSLAQNTGDKKTPALFRNTDDIPNLISDSNEKHESRTGRKFPRRFMETWDNQKAMLNQNYGFNFSLAYHYVFQGGYSDSRDVTGSGGQAEFDFTWTPFRRSGTGTKGVFGGKIESQHKVFNTNAPQSVAPKAGSVWTGAPGYGAFDISVSQLWYEHHLIRDRVLVRAGKISPFTMFDYYRFKSTRAEFLGQIQTFNPTIAFPPSALGVAVGALLTNRLYAEAGVFDANGTPDQAGFNTLFNRRETFKIADIGWTPDFLFGGDPGKNDFHLTAWHADRRVIEGIPEGWGLTVSAQRGFGNFVPFVRYGYANGGATALEHFASAGLGIEDAFGYSNDLIGMSFGWGRPSNSQLRDQYSSEIFYRMQLTPNFAMTPNIQVVLDPALDTTAGLVGIFSVRVRLTL